MPRRIMMREDQRGFTLIEVMVAMLIAAVVLLALGNMLITAIRTNQQSEHRMDAAATAQSIMANLSTRATTLNYTQTAANTEAQAQLPAGSIYTPSILINPSPVVAGSAMVTVTLAWQEHGANKTMVLHSEVWAQ